LWPEVTFAFCNTRTFRTTSEDAIICLHLIGSLLSIVYCDSYRRGGESIVEITRAKLGLTTVSDRFRYAESEFSCTSVIHNGVSTEIQDGDVRHLEILKVS
jgi:hypothetical protein